MCSHARRALIGVLCAVVFAFMLSVGAGAGELFPRDEIMLPFAPAAMAEGPAALRFNPASLGMDPGFGLNLYHTYSDSSLRGDDAVYLSFQGAGLAIEWLGAGAEKHGRSYTIGLGTSGDRALTLGSSYQWRSSDDPVQDKSHFWSHGIRWRPSDLLSLAFVVDNFNRMKVEGKRSDAELVYSAALRYLNGRLTVGGDWYQGSSQSWRDGSYRLAATFEPTGGLTLYADVDQHRDYAFGARVDLATWFAGTHASFDRHSGYRGGVAYAGVHSTRARPLVKFRREALRLSLEGDIPDRKPPVNFFGATPPTTLDLVNVLDKAAGDPSVRAVVVKINNPRLGWARADELRRALGRVRRSGKYTIAYLEGSIGNREYYLACAADKIVVPPVSTVDVIGLRSEVTFATRLLDKLGIKADLEHIGEYKSAAELVTRTEMSPAHRAALENLLDDLDRHWVAEMAQSRGVTVDRVREWINHGPYVSMESRSAGLVDTVAYADQLEDIVADASGSTCRTVPGRELAARGYRRNGWAPLPRVAVVFAAGSIHEGDDQDDLLLGEMMGGRTVSRAIRQARRDRRVKAIVLRIDSGGGSVFASDDIWREVEQTKGKKPIVVSFADVAASGGYYIACAADSIFALPGTITGSIGVISGKLDLSGLYGKIGLDRQVLTRGRYADMYGTSRSFDDDERAVVKSQLRQAYDRFVSLVAAGRHLTPDSVDAIGQGRVWSGTAARERGLVDRFADLHEVIGVAARMGKVSPGHEVQVEMLPERRWRLFDFGGLDPLAVALTARGLPGQLAREILPTALPSRGGPDGNDLPAYEFPYVITIR